MPKKKYKVALLCICLNQPYWEYAKSMMESAHNFFLRDHDVDFIFWSDMPETEGFGATVIPTEPVTWPYPTLLRYNLFLQEEQRLKEYDYIFYCDIDMLFVDTVGDEILGEGLTAAPHPGYYINPMFVPPIEPNPSSTAYVKRLTASINYLGKEKSYPFYAAGGFQGGETKSFLQAMKIMKTNIETDLNNNYVAIWNDESHWNKYLLDFQQNRGVITFLTPSYVYPDSLVNELYVPRIWGVNYPPKLVTITKKFSLSKEGGDVLKELLGT